MRLACLLFLFLFGLGFVLYLTVDFNSAASYGSSESQRNLPPLSADFRFDRLVIEKSARTLTAFSKEKIVRVYKIALGGTPIGHKEVEGDKKTPEGIYKVDGKNPNSTYYKNLGVSYPNAADKKRAAALGKSPGGAIKIHGLGPKWRYLGRQHWRFDWTLGCIAVTDEEIDELYAHTNIGTVIEIRP